jgi:hypothetical protein
VEQLVMWGQYLSIASLNEIELTFGEGHFVNSEGAVISTGKDFIIVNLWRIRETPLVLGCTFHLGVMATD